jgi:hypothetical protein
MKVTIERSAGEFCYLIRVGKSVLCFAALGDPLAGSPDTFRIVAGRVAVGDGVVKVVPVGYRDIPAEDVVLRDIVRSVARSGLADVRESRFLKDEVGIRLDTYLRNRIEPWSGLGDGCELGPFLSGFGGLLKAKVHRVTGVKWDTDGASLSSCGLKRSVSVPWGMDGEAVSDWLSSEYGFCHDGWSGQNWEDEEDS